MKLEPTENLSLIRSMLASDEIWPNSSEDGQNSESLRIDPVEGVHWFLAMSEAGEVAGFAKIERASLSEVRAHIGVKPEFRGMGSAGAFKALVRLFFEGMDGRIVKMTAQAPEYNEAVLRMALASGFVEEGVNRESIMKNGRLRNQIILGMTREEAGQWLRL